MIIALIGVAGSGKTTDGHLLSQELKWTFADADDLHPARNIEKMKSGTELTDFDRNPWLENSRCIVEQFWKSETNAVFAFPGLTEQHRKRVLGDWSDIKIVHLVGSFELIEERLKKRKDHFFPVELLHTQFDILEPPVEALNIDVTPLPEEIVKTIRGKLNV